MLAKFIDGLSRAFSEFLTIPTVIVGSFILLTIGMYALDRSGIEWVADLRDIIQPILFEDSQTTTTTMSTVAGSLITVTSIIFTVLLLAVQQAAATMTTTILDQFLRRRLNQIVFGYFVGVAFYATAILATIDRSFNPILSATLALLLTIIALYLLVAVVYVTLTQVRPSVVTQGIHDGALSGRKREIKIVRRTHPQAMLRDVPSQSINAESTGYVTHIDLDRIERALGSRTKGIEIILRVRLGSYIALDDTVAEIRSHWDHVDGLDTNIVHAIKIGRARNLRVDPRHGIEEIMNIGWTSISTSKHFPVGGLNAIDALRDLLAEWTREDDDGPHDDRLPVVYAGGILNDVLEAVESLGIVSSESMNHLTFAAVIDVFATMYDRLPAEQQDHSETIILRLLSTFGDHVLSLQLERSVSRLIAALHAAGRVETADAVTYACEAMSTTIGTLNSRSSRAHAAKQ